MAAGEGWRGSNSLSPRRPRCQHGPPESQSLLQHAALRHDPRPPKRAFARATQVDLSLVPSGQDTLPCASARVPVPRVNTCPSRPLQPPSSPYPLPHHPLVGLVPTGPYTSVCCSSYLVSDFLFCLLFSTSVRRASVGPHVLSEEVRAVVLNFLFAPCFIRGKLSRKEENNDTYTSLLVKKCE